MISNLEEFNKLEEKRWKKKRKTKEILIILLIIFIITGLYISTTLVKKNNIEKLGNDYCEYNGKHPIETGMKGEIYSTCIGCSKIMKFEHKITDKLCENCSQKLHRCKQCGKLLQY